jgi:hypothetical protein
LILRRAHRCPDVDWVFEDEISRAIERGGISDWDVDWVWLHVADPLIRILILSKVDEQRVIDGGDSNPTSMSYREAIKLRIDAACRIGRVSIFAQTAHRSRQGLW